MFTGVFCRSGISNDLLYLFASTPFEAILTFRGSPLLLVIWNLLLSGTVSSDFSLSLAEGSRKHWTPIWRRANSEAVPYHVAILQHPGLKENGLNVQGRVTWCPKDVYVGLQDFDNGPLAPPT